MNASPLPSAVAVTEFNPCQGTGRFALDRFWADGETLTIEEDSYPMEISKPWWELSFQQYKTEVGEEGFPGMSESAVYVFPFEVINGQAEAAQGEIDKTLPESGALRAFVG